MVDNKDRQKFKEAMISDDFLDQVIKWIKSHFYPEEIFDIIALDDWAKEHGYRKEPD